jgi:ElaB/YqjD/DUF883 family membrane-anchored ribosome-binding protein
MNELNSAAQVAAHKAFDSTMNHTADTLRPALDQLMASLHGAVDRLNHVASQTAEQLAHSGERIKDAQQRVVGGARSYVRTQPLTTVGVAVAAGFLLSWALLRQR